MQISWKTMGRVISCGCIMLPFAITLGLASTVFPNSAMLAVFALIGWGVLLLTGLFGAVVVLLYLSRRLKITCPLCGKASELVSVKSYTYLRCSACGNVHAQGFFQNKYLVKE